MKFITRAATVGAASLVAGALVAVPSSAATAGPVSYDCGVPVLGTTTFTATATSTAPATLVAGQSFTPTITATISVPESLRSLLYGLAGARTVEGATWSDELGLHKSTFTYSVGGQAVTADATLPSTPVPATEGAFDVVATIVGQPVTPTAAGSLPLVAGDFVAAIAGVTEGGTPSLLSPYELKCTQQAGQTNTIDTVSVTKAPTTTKVKAKYAKKKITSKIAVLGGAPATGKATVVVKLGKKTIKKATVAVRAGQAKLVVKRITKKGKYTVKVAYKGDAGHLGSKGKATVKVK